MSAFPGSIAFDEFGRPFIILRDQENQKRLTGNDAIKVSLPRPSIRDSSCVRAQSLICGRPLRPRRKPGAAERRRSPKTPVL